MIKQIKQAYRDFYKQFRFNLSASNNPVFIGFYKYLYRPKKGSFDDFLNEYSKSKIGDFQAVQIGANDGITHDPIHKFIKRDEWKGVLLEPQFYVYDTFLKKIYYKNKGIKTIRAALGDVDGMTTLYKIGFTNMRWATGLASFNREALAKAFTNGSVARNCKKYGIKFPSDGRTHIVAEEVPVLSPKSLLKQYDVPRIDLLQIDTEGFDYEVIRMFDIANTQPKVINFESVHLSEKDTEACFKLLKENDYVWMQESSNTLAMKRSVVGFEHFFKD